MLGKPKAAKILSEDDAVIQMPRRAYPAIAIQGDTLSIWRQQINDIAKRAKASGDEELIETCDELREQIEGCFERYNHVCRQTNRGGFPTQTEGSRGD